MMRYAKDGDIIPEPTVIELTIPLLLPSLNQTQGRGHWSFHAREKNRWADWILVAKLNQAKVYGWPRYERARIEIDRYCVSMIKDADNLAGGGPKYVLDGLKKHGLILDDSMDRIGRPEIKQIRCPRAEQRTVIRIYPEGPAAPLDAHLLQ